MATLRARHPPTFLVSAAESWLGHLLMAYSELVSRYVHVNSSGVQRTSTPSQPQSSLSSNAPSSQPPPLLHQKCPTFASGFNTNPHCKHVFVLCVSGLQLGKPSTHVGSPPRWYNRPPFPPCESFCQTSIKPF